MFFGSSTVLAPDPVGCIDDGGGDSADIAGSGVVAGGRKHYAGFAVRPLSRELNNDWSRRCGRSR
jgi:hypothetical protein